MRNEMTFIIIPTVKNKSMQANNDKKGRKLWKPSEKPSKMEPVQKPVARPKTSTNGRETVASGNHDWRLESGGEAPGGEDDNISCKL